MRGTVSDYSLSVKGGANSDNLQLLAVNNESCPTRIESDLFSGYLMVRMKDFAGVGPEDVPCLPNPKSDYFSSKQRLYTISIQGAFKEDVPGDDLIFGLEFTHPIKTPPGASIGLRIARWLEPNLDYDIYSSEPFMVAPVLTCINFLGVHSKEDFVKLYPHTKNNDPIPGWAYDSSPIVESNAKISPSLSSNSNPIERKKYFAKKPNRAKVIFKKSDIVSLEFYDAHFDFNQFRIVLPGFSLNAFKYWNGHPIKFTCCSNDRKKVYFVVVFDLQRSAHLEGMSPMSPSVDSNMSGGSK